MPNKMNMVVFSGSVDKLMPVAIIASAAAQMGVKVTLFFTFWGIMAARKDMVDKNDKISSEFAEYKEKMFEIMQKSNMKPWYKMLEEAKQTGNLKIYACSHTLDMFGMEKEHLIDIFDDVVGVGTFLMESEDAEVIFI